MVVSASIGIFIIALPNRLFSRFPGMGNIIATIWAMDNIHHFMAIIHSFPESPFRLSQIPMAVKINVSPKTPAIWISLVAVVNVTLADCFL